MNNKGALVLSLALCLALPVTASKAISHKFVPPDGKVLLVVGQDVKNINAYLKATNDVPGGLAIYTSAEYADGLENRVDHGGGVQHAQFLVEKYPNTVLQIGLWMVDTEKRITSGAVDDSLDHLASWIKRTARPVYLRIGYEFDYPENNYDPHEYVKAYRYIVDRFRDLNVENVAYVWHSYGGYVSRPHMDWYPGDDYVDWTAISYFRQPRKYMDQFADVAEKLNKPFMIAEASPWHVSTTLGLNSWKKWFVPLFYFMEEKNVKALCYINCDWDDMSLFSKHKWGDARIQQHKDVKSRWMKEISKEKYLKSSPTLFKQLGFGRAHYYPPQEAPLEAAQNLR